MTLDKGQINHVYKLKSMNLPLKVEKRLEALGMTRDTEIKVLNNKSHGTLIIYVRGTRFAVGRNISENIGVE